MNFINSNFINEFNIKLKSKFHITLTSAHDLYTKNEWNQFNKLINELELKNPHHYNTVTNWRVGIYKRKVKDKIPKIWMSKPLISFDYSFKSLPLNKIIHNSFILLEKLEDNKILTIENEKISFLKTKGKNSYFQVKLFKNNHFKLYSIVFNSYLSFKNDEFKLIVTESKLEYFTFSKNCLSYGLLNNQTVFNSKYNLFINEWKLNY